MNTHISKLMYEFADRLDGKDEGESAQELAPALRQLAEAVEQIESHSSLINAHVAELRRLIPIEQRPALPSLPLPSRELKGEMVLQEQQQRAKRHAEWQGVSDKIEEAKRGFVTHQPSQEATELSALIERTLRGE